MSAGPGSVLVVGIPRSGSTWIGNVLGRAAGGPLLHEPDNEKEQLAALTAKAGLGRFPVLAPGDSAPAYERLWQRALRGEGVETRPGARASLAARVWRGVPVNAREAAVQGRPTPRTRLATALAGSPSGSPHGSRAPRESVRVVKSVHAPLAVEWLADLFPSTRVVLVVRHPANVLASWLDMKLPDRDRGLDRSDAVRSRYLEPWGVPGPGPGASALYRSAWQASFLTAAVLDVAARRPDLTLVRHDALCVDPAASFPPLARSVGLPWTPAAREFLLSSDRPGDGFVVQRRAADQPDRWRSRLGSEEIDALLDAAGLFPGLGPWLSDLRTPASTAGQG